jgi:hypothetical protein
MEKATEEKRMEVATEEKHMKKTTMTAVSEEITTTLTADESSVPTMIEITKHNEGGGKAPGCHIG